MRASRWRSRRWKSKPPRQSGNKGRNDLALGQRVFHGKFGYGTIAAIEGNKLEIDFEHAGPQEGARQLRERGMSRDVNLRPF